MLSRQRQNGRSMIEMLGVLGIMAVITVLSIAAYTMAMKNIKTNNAKSDVSSIVQQVIAMSNGNYIDVDFADQFVATGLWENATSAFGKGAYGLFHTAAATATSSSSFKVAISGISFEECSLLKSQNWQGVENGPVCKTEAPADAAYAAGTACTSATGSTACNFVIEYK